MFAVFFMPDKENQSAGVQCQEECVDIQQIKAKT